MWSCYGCNFNSSQLLCLIIGFFYFSSFLSAFVDVVGSLFLCAMTIVAALMITLGFLVWCDEMTKRFPS